MASIFKAEDTQHTAYVFMHALTGYALAKTAGRLWHNLRPFADPRLLLATSLMQWSTIQMFARLDGAKNEPPKVTCVLALVGSNALVLTAFHFSGTTLRGKSALLVTVASTIAGIVAGRGINKWNSKENPHSYY